MAKLFCLTTNPPFSVSAAVASSSPPPRAHQGEETDPGGPLYMLRTFADPPHPAAWRAGCLSVCLSLASSCMGPGAMRRGNPSTVQLGKNCGQCSHSTLIISCRCAGIHTCG